MTGIVIHRSHHAQQYVVVPNAIARNTRLSFRARGLLVMLLSLPPEWHVTADILAADNPDSRTAIRAAMAELRDAGYVEMHKEQDRRGRWTTRLEVFDTATTGRVQAAFGATSENSASPLVAPNAGIPAAGGAAPKKKYRTSSRARAARGEDVKTSTAAAPRTAPPCPECGRPFSQDQLSDPDFRAMALAGRITHDECAVAAAAAPPAQCVRHGNPVGADGRCRWWTERVPCLTTAGARP